MMIRRLTVLFSIFVIFTGVFSPSMAQSPASDVASAQNKALQNKVSDLLQTLSQEEAMHFFALYTNYNIYSMVKAVNEDVGNAVSACAENNKEMASELNSRYGKWNDSVGGNMKEAYSNLNNLSLAQTYLPQSEIKKIFDLVDKVRSINSSRFETTPVTTPEACEFMLSKMDETEESMNRMLQATLASYPNIMKKSQK